MPLTTGSRSGDGLVIKQLLHVLREQVISALFVQCPFHTLITGADNLTRLDKPPDLTLDEVCGRTHPLPPSDP